MLRYSFVVLFVLGLASVVNSQDHGSDGSIERPEDVDEPREMGDEIAEDSINNVSVNPKRKSEARTRVGSDDEDEGATGSGARETTEGVQAGARSQLSVKDLQCDCQSTSNQQQRCICESGEDFTCLVTESTTRPLMKRKRDNAAEDSSVSVVYLHQNSSTYPATYPSVIDGNATEIAVPLPACKCNCSTPSQVSACSCMSDSDEHAHCSNFTCSALSLDSYDGDDDDTGAGLSKVRVNSMKSSSPPGTKPTCVILLLPLALIGTLLVKLACNHRG